MAAHYRDAGLRYVAACENASLSNDVGSYCSVLHEDRGDSRIYATGPVFSEFDTWLLLGEQADGWHVVDTASAGNLDSPQPPPW
jgi:hypothetical protein